MSRLNLELGELPRVVDSADARPTTQAVAAYGELQRAVRTPLARWNEMRTRDVSALDERLKKVGLPAIALTPTTESKKHQQFLSK